MVSKHKGKSKEEGVKYKILELKQKKYRLPATDKYTVKVQLEDGRILKFGVYSFSNIPSAGYLQEKIGTKLSEMLSDETRRKAISELVGKEGKASDKDC